MNREPLVKPVVVLPVHIAKPSSMELISLRQCGRVLGHRDILILAPEGLDLGFYRELLPRADELRVAPHWMASVQAYNRMMISPLVFEAMRGYSHMLVHEPDAIVLRDDLDYWCAQPYDYIGAPWFEGYGNPTPDAPVIGVGNFGLSLHRLETARRLISSRRRWYSYCQVAKDIVRGFQGRRLQLRTGIRALGTSGQLRCAWRLYSGHCDAFWSFVVPRVDPLFRVAPAEDAVRFAWEVLPARCMVMCNGQLPFGIHAWAKHDLEFLRGHLLQVGVDLEGLKISK